MSRFCWNTIGGDHYEGRITEADNGTLLVECDDGVVRAVRVDDLIVEGDGS